MRQETIDEAMTPVSYFFEIFQSILDGEIYDEAGYGMCVQQISLSLPVEMDIDKTVQGEIAIGIAPPTQQVETSFMPVFHQLSMVIERS